MWGVRWSTDDSVGEGVRLRLERAGVGHSLHVTHERPVKLECEPQCQSPSSICEILPTEAAMDLDVE